MISYQIELGREIPCSNSAINSFEKDKISLELTKINSHVSNLFLETSGLNSDLLISSDITSTNVDMRKYQDSLIYIFREILQQYPNVTKLYLNSPVAHYFIQSDRRDIQYNFLYQVSSRNGETTPIGLFDKLLNSPFRLFLIKYCNFTNLHKNYFNVSSGFQGNSTIRELVFMSSTTSFHILENLINRLDNLEYLDLYNVKYTTYFESFDIIIQKIISSRQFSKLKKFKFGTGVSKKQVSLDTIILLLNTPTQLKYCLLSFYEIVNNNYLSADSTINNTTLNTLKLHSERVTSPFSLLSIWKDISNLKTIEISQNCI
ncbi:hypothetical protein DLAC_02935 [Tieghemostelium lacteum]|uniref:Uncharacterized protein n=1 Tax=Tieghemostelium lacteum TaxID=361077 RepID=A0A152A461_TIELA|nr:hypothetical protein DLAC_02935 [Tieghemostelium lacteum]|eukprot:KYR00875.1 hypothetical protein DLAC_02935 [Tieghemostelium lacteum]